MGCVASRAMNEAEQRGQARTDNGASCNGVGNASREQDECVAGPPIAGEDENKPKHETRKRANRPRIRRRLAVEGEDEGGADADASPQTARTEHANEDHNDV